MFVVVVLRTALAPLSTGQMRACALEVIGGVDGDEDVEDVAVRDFPVVLRINVSISASTSPRRRL